MRLEKDAERIIDGYVRATLTFAGIARHLAPMISGEELARFHSCRFHVPQPDDAYVDCGTTLEVFIASYNN